MPSLPPNLENWPLPVLRAYLAGRPREEKLDLFEALVDRLHTLVSQSLSLPHEVPDAYLQPTPRPSSRPQRLLLEFVSFSTRP